MNTNQNTSPNAPQSPVSPQEFLRAVIETVDDPIYEFRLIARTESESLNPSEYSRYESDRLLPDDKGKGAFSICCRPPELESTLLKLSDISGKKWDVYYCVNHRRYIGDRGDNNIKSSTTFFVDFDGVTLDEVMRRLDEHHLTDYVSGIVSSGHGYHPYFFLDKEITPKQFTFGQLALITLLESDPSIHNPERIMRLPGFMNWKNEPGKAPAMASLLSFNGKKNNADDLARLINDQLTPEQLENIKTHKGKAAKVKKAKPAEPETIGAEDTKITKAIESESEYLDLTDAFNLTPSDQELSFGMPKQIVMLKEKIEDMPVYGSAARYRWSMNVGCALMESVLRTKDYQTDGISYEKAFDLWKAICLPNMHGSLSDYDIQARFDRYKGYVIQSHPELAEGKRLDAITDAPADAMALEAIKQPNSVPEGDINGFDGIQDASTEAITVSPDNLSPEEIRKQTIAASIARASKIVPDCLKVNETANAERIKLKFGNDIRHVDGIGWHCWNGSFWESSETLLNTYTTEAINGIYAECEVCRRQDATNTGKWNRSLYGKPAARHNILNNWMMESLNNNRIENTWRILRRLDGIRIQSDSLNQNPFLLAVQNGTIDLSTGMLRPHRREDYLTKLSPVKYDPAALCPVFDKFMDEVFANDSELIDYVIQLLGYCLTGDISEDFMWIFHGNSKNVEADGNNGKSTLLKVMRHILGDMCDDAPATLLSGGREEHPTEFASLQGLRLAIIAEPRNNSPFKMDVLKRLTGEPSVKARKMGQDFYRFQRTHKMIVLCNALPPIFERSCAAWRRVRAVPFNVSFTGRVDTHLGDKLKAESSGILNRLISGCLSWQTQGFQEPKKVKSATQEYKLANDIMGQFLDEKCVFNSEAWETSELINAKYRMYCEYCGKDPESQKVLGEYLAARGCTHKLKKLKGQVIRGWQGVMIPKEEVDYSCHPDLSAPDLIDFSQPSPIPEREIVTPDEHIDEDDPFGD